MKYLALIIFSILSTIGSFAALAQNVSDKKSNTFSTIENVNIDTVKQERIKRHNQERKKYGLSGYILDNNLNISAKTRSDKLSKLGKSTHQRTSKDGYYNYGSIISRFSGLGINFEDESGTLFSESIGRGYYKCSKKDCTQDLVKSIKSTFKFFMSEKGKQRKPHYKAIVMDNFSNIGVGISIDKKTNRYFLVSHYGVNTINTGK